MCGGCRAFIVVGMFTTATKHQLPQLGGRIFLTEAGLETDLIFQHGIELPDFAAFPLLESEPGRGTLRDYYQGVIDLARRAHTGVVLETPTWRANPDWAERLGYDTAGLDAANRDGVALLAELRAENSDVTVVISGNLGPRGDGYSVSNEMTAIEAATYHRAQIESFAAAGADQICALTLGDAAEAIGIVDAARDVDIASAIAFTVETDGALPSGAPLAEAIAEVDRATDSAAAYFAINCAHPTHFAEVLAGPGPWHRIRAIRANASRMSHEELDNATELDRGDEGELAAGYHMLLAGLPDLAVVGGCCGTDIAHLEAISAVIHGRARAS